MAIYNHDKIVAIATPPGSGALAIIRVSGNNLKTLYKLLTKSFPKNRYALFSKLYHPINNEILDHVIITYFCAPNSFTGEDIIEISCHGAETIKESIINAIVKTDVRLASPGEFSYRAFLNGKIDLIQAESIASLVNSKTSLSTEVSLRHLDGKVSNLLQNIKQETIKTLTIIEKELDFSETEITHTSIAKIKLLLENIFAQLKLIISSSVAGKDIFNGIKIVLYGPPNSGKSSLFNSILGKERAIVSSTPGTTRDTIESWFEIKGVPVCLIDTAGIWESKESLDQISVKKTYEELRNADLCIIVDEKNPKNYLSNRFKKIYKSRYILVKSKCDLDDKTTQPKKEFLYISSKNNTGIDNLLTKISTQINKKIDVSRNSEGVLITSRQRGLIVEAQQDINNAIEQLSSGIETDIVSSTLRGFVEKIKEITGDIPNKDVVENIFKEFCIGK